MILYIIAVIVVAIFILLLIFKMWYKVVPSSQAHLVISGSGKRGVYSSDTKFSTTGKTSYFSIPEWIPHFGRIVRHLDVTVKELNYEQETFEKDNAKYNVTTSTKYRVVDVQKAAESFTNESELHTQLKEIIQATTREITKKYDITTAMAKRREISLDIKNSITDDFSEWGVVLVNFVLVDFKNASDNTVITDIAKRREVEINCMTREQNADREKQARMKEAEADEKATQREIERDRTVGEQVQIKAQKIAEKEKAAQEKAYEVTKVQILKQAEINKDAAVIKAEEDKKVNIIKAEQEKESEEILKIKKKLEGEGNRLRAEEIAKGEAAPIREKGNAEADIIQKKLIAEAKGKDELQKSLNKFTQDAIKALTAELAYNVQRDIGIAGANALKSADIRMFVGSDGGDGFDIGKIIAQTKVSNESTANALINRLAKPNDLGINLSLGNVSKSDKKINKK